MFAELLQKIRQTLGKVRAARIEILPPWQGSRAKPDPKRPHHRRVVEVREAMASAPPGSSFRKLIEHIRRRTGAGASPKLIGRLRRGGMLIILVPLLGSGCRITDPASAAEADRPRLIKIRLTITSADDLKVKTGEMIPADTILADRRSDRLRLDRQRHLLALNLRRIDAQTSTINASIRLLDQIGSAVPAYTFAAEKAAIRSAETETAAEWRKVELQRRRAAEIPGLLPEGLDRETVAAHEANRLGQVEDVHRQSLARLDLVRARAESAREAREFELKRHSVEIARQLLAARSQLQQAEIARAQISAQMAAIDDRLAELGVVRAPFGGKVERISWEEQHDRTINVLLYLSITNTDGTDGADGSR
ncbi:MAG: hypothetical protein KIT57_09005 [Blastocatellales bacterium]|nr:hypothetical protein [Blastocatellales bacterium]